MTTTVKIEASCAQGTEVFVSIADPTEGETFTLQDGESATRYIYDDREITVMERPKQ